MPKIVKALYLSTLALAVSMRGHAQSPAGPVRLAWPSTLNQFANAVVALPDGGMLFAFYEFWGPDDPSKYLLVKFDQNDSRVGEPYRVIPPARHGCCTGVAGNQEGNLVLVGSLWSPYAYRFNFSGGPRRLRLDTADKQTHPRAQAAAIDRSGSFVAIWSREEDGDKYLYSYGIFGRLVDAAGVPLGPEIHVNTVTEGDQFDGVVARAAATGAFVVVWRTDTANGRQTAGQLFTAKGEKIGGEFRVGKPTPNLPHGAVAMAPDGSFVVTWQEPAREGSARDVVRAQRFSPEGKPLGQPLDVSEGLPAPQEYPQIASDDAGNFIITWSDDALKGITMGRLYRADGTPVTAPIPLTLDFGHLGSRVAFGWNGTFVLGWSDVFALTGTVAYARRFSASPGPEACVFRQGGFLCDTGRTGGPPEVRHPFGGPEGTGLLGDMDGDGRADPCVYRDGRFLCDTAHDYGTAEYQRAFGTAGDKPLLGDVDGDGRADPCVFRSGRFLCDTLPEIDLAGEGEPLLGDADGDRRSDPCLFHSGVFTCDADHDGAADHRIGFGRSGDIPFLVDFDSDGRSEACVYRTDRFLCDTAHDGGEAETVLVFGEGNGTPLLANLDGL